jgi:hypothetical protein
MPLLRYFLAVGTTLTAAILAASTYLESQAPTAAAHISVAPTTASLYIPPPAKPVSTASTTPASLPVPPPPVKPSKKTRH